MVGAIANTWTPRINTMVRLIRPDSHKIEFMKKS
jgi:hypothetical protein